MNVDDFTVDTQLLLDILSDGSEYAARGFWAQIEVFKWYWWYQCDKTGEPINAWEDAPRYGDRINPDLTDATSLLRVRDDEDAMAEVEGREFVDITLGKLKEATLWALTNYNHLFSPFTVENNVITDINYDAIGADVIIQKIVLGEVTYG